jgi:hypothetical protein
MTVIRLIVAVTSAVIDILIFPDSLSYVSNQQYEDNSQQYLSVLLPGLQKYDPGQKTLDDHHHQIDCNFFGAEIILLSKYPEIQF